MTTTTTDRIDTQLVDQLLRNYQQPATVLGENGLLKQFTKALLERALQVELRAPLGDEQHSSAGANSGNARHGTSEKTRKGDFGDLPIEVPRDRKASVAPKIVPQGQTRRASLNERVLSLDARRMTTPEIPQHIAGIYHPGVSPTRISNVTGAVLGDVVAWRTRPLEAIHPILSMDALEVEVRDGAQVVNKAAHLAIGVTRAGHKDVRGLWLGQTDGAKRWRQIVTGLKNRGVQDVLSACVDGLKGFPEAIETVCPKAQAQLCIVHMVRQRLNFVGDKPREEVAADRSSIYRPATRAEAELHREAFADEWDAKYPSLRQSGRREWERITPCLAYPAGSRRVS